MNNDTIISEIRDALENFDDRTPFQIKVLLVNAKDALTKSIGLTDEMMDELYAVAINYQELAEEMVEEGDESLADCYRADMKDILEIHTLLSEGKVSKACDKIYSLDTIVRESIPMNLWDWYCVKRE